MRLAVESTRRLVLNLAVVDACGSCCDAFELVIALIDLHTVEPGLRSREATEEQQVMQQGSSWLAVLELKVLQAPDFSNDWI
ncbi:hypothetical protein N9U66_03595 [Synechococcus sp. AH-736-M20]|nr:hypothetical protein [Synechococcus sp. AH-736-M20]